jgi:SAM-dependent methyltransferase
VTGRSHGPAFASSPNPNRRTLAAMIATEVGVKPARPDGAQGAVPSQGGRPRLADVTVSYDLGVEPYEELWSPVILPAATALLPWLGLGEDAVVLDVGGGTGAVAPAIRSVAPRATLVAVDASIEMLRTAQSARRVPAVQGDAMHLPISGTTVDAVILAYVLFHLADPLVGLQEARRVLRLGGRVATVTWASERAAPAQKLWDEALAKAGAPPIRLRRSDVGLDSVEAMERLLRVAEFRPIRVWPKRLSRPWDSESFFALASGAGPSRQRLAGLEPRARSSLLRGIREQLDQLPAEAFWWQGEVICAVAAKDCE